ncbi:PilZ domain-containing protein [Gayadomonas joobiniege]|uniref:PilZ domain-containing protein n=1 Tax=Gayadomonas joobiniege TaxID=1234606 RepID=UPI00036A9C0A|nr:PilZ domain-containing protein [Gayadomonas joobiniege]
MTPEEKQTLFDEFFTLPMQVTINLQPLSADQEEPDVEALSEEIPYPFKLASQFKQMEQGFSASQQKVQNLNEDVFAYLNMQNRKIDLVLSFLLMQENNNQARYLTETFGAGGLTLITDKNWSLEQIFQLKIFIPEEASAVYCYARIVDKQSAASGFIYKLVYSQILEADREVLVRAALHEQSKQLRALAKKRAEKNNTHE